MTDYSNNGMILEFGVKTGGTITRIAKHFPQHKVYGFDWFWGLTEDWAKMKKGALSCDGKPPANLPSNVELVVGLVEETLPKFLLEHPEPVDFIHMDFDTYSPTRFTLFWLADRMRAGTIIVFDEYHNYPGYENYEYKAFDEFKVAYPCLKWKAIDTPFPIGYNPIEEFTFECVFDGDHNLEIGVPVPAIG